MTYTIELMFKLIRNITDGEVLKVNPLANCMESIIRYKDKEYKIIIRPMAIDECFELGISKEDSLNLLDKR